MESFTVGTGASIYTQKLLPSILAAEQEIILVTCYWAPSESLAALCNTLEQLARRRQSQRPSEALRVRICFSSRSLFQKLFHTSSSDGYVYPPSTWTSKLGLPSAEALAAAKIDLKVKSLFFLPFSVMHPKFLIVDRQRAFLPSCNISWEAWLEACLELSRIVPQQDAIDGLLEFYKTVWEKDLDLALPVPRRVEAPGGEIQSQHTAVIRSPADTSVSLLNIEVLATAVEWLPSPHRRNPAFCLFPWSKPKPPDTPLNKTLLRLFEEASRHVFLQTPNLTSPPVLAAILDTLARGVDVDIVTGRKMMVWEQMLTAGTTSQRCIRRLTKDYARLCESRRRLSAASQHGSAIDVDVEAQLPSPGLLTISYFRPTNGHTTQEPVQSHVKLSIFDGERVILGSGNMDRASWFTSQELGILVQGTPFATAVKEAVDRSLEGRLDPAFGAN